MTSEDEETYLPRLGKVRKSHPRIEAFGSVDELSCFVGLARLSVKDEELNGLLKTIQDSLFHLGSHLAVSNHPLDRVAACLEKLKSFDKKAETLLPPLRKFIYPSGVEAAVVLHVCRAVCRRAERALVRLAESEPVEPLAVEFLNFLSKFFFTAARYVNYLSGVDEDQWTAA